MFEQDAKPANEYAEHAVALMDSAKLIHKELDGLGTAVKDRYMQGKYKRMQRWAISV